MGSRNLYLSKVSLSIGGSNKDDNHFLEGEDLLSGQ